MTIGRNADTAVTSLVLGHSAQEVYPPGPSTVPLDVEGVLVEAVIRRGDSPHTRRAYRSDLESFRRWLVEVALGWDEVTADELDGYREWLAARYARTTVNRRLVVVRTLYGEAQRRHLIGDDPAARLRGLRGRDDRDGGALTLAEARAVLRAIRADEGLPGRRLLACRDLALASLLLRTGIRGFELANLRVSSRETKQGYPVLSIRNKGNVTRTVKLPADVRGQIDDWLAAAADAGIALEADDPIFIEVRRGGHLLGRRPLSGRAIYAVVERRVRDIGIERLGPHALRATFVTLALEGGAPLHLVQRAVGHADPRTTERYWRRKDALDQNAVDYVKL
jgi:site-specific recombinase XerD